MFTQTCQNLYCERPLNFIIKDKETFLCGSCHFIITAIPDLTEYINTNYRINHGIGWIYKQNLYNGCYHCWRMKIEECEHI